MFGPDGFSPNGLLPNEVASVTQALEPERWATAEERTTELIACIQPNQPSEERRNAVLCYVQRLIMNCFPCQVFTFGSVPLKTYLPDGDIDLTVFTENLNLKETWANEVRDILEHEEKNENAEFHVKEVQYIQAEVKIIKCLVENIVVDISFDQLGGLCTLCFLEEVDQLIGQNHLFKRSIILIKAWCYYESRILGAHHGLISTYALETLVLYIFHVFNNKFAGPLEVLYRFLDFFSKFDWENFCISLWGPVPISSLPDMTALSPRKDGGQILLSKFFLDVCSSVYAVVPSRQENQEQSFISKYFNVVDPLRANNNLGRSVSKGNFFRIRSAFAFGAQRLDRLLDCPKENLLAEFKQFFLNTWERHGKGHRPDAPSSNHVVQRPIRSNVIDGPGTIINYSGSKKTKEDPSGHQSKVGVTHAAHASDSVSSLHVNHNLKQTSRPGNISAISGTRGQSMQANLTNSMVSHQNNQNLRCNSLNENPHNEKMTSSGTHYLGNDVNPRYQFARTQSSPELTDTSSDVSSRGRHNRASETVNGQTASARSHSSRRRNLVPEVLENHGAKFSTEDSLSSRHSLSHQIIDASVDSTSASNSYFGNSGEGTIEDHLSLSETMQLHHEEQDRVDMASFSSYSVNEQGQMPMNLASGQPPFVLPPSVLASLGYAQKHMVGTAPINAASFESSWVSNLHYPRGFIQNPESQCFPSMGMTSDQEVTIEKFDAKLAPTELSQEECDHGFWSKPDADSVRHQQKNRSSQTRLQEHRQPLASVESNHVHSSRVSSSGSFSPRDHSLITEERGLIRENYSGDAQYQIPKESDAYSPTSFRFVPASETSSSGSKSEDNGDGLLLRTYKSMKDRRGKKSVPSTDSSIAYGMDRNERQCEEKSVDHISLQPDDDNTEWISLSTIGTELSESMVSGVDASHVWNHQIPIYDPASVNRSNSMLSVAPMFVGPNSHQRTSDNHGALPFAFYPTGPPVPFLALVPLYNVPTEAGTSSVSTRKLDMDEESDNSQNNHSNQSLDSSENVDWPEILNTFTSVNNASSSVHSEQRRSEILNSDFASHWQNLQYGRFCQNARNNDSLPHPSPVVAPPMYLQGHFPWDGPGRPSVGMNLLTQHMNGPHLIPVSPVHPGSSRQPGFYQHYADNIPRYRAGTGTYLPNPKISYRDRQFSNSRNHRGNNNYDRKDHHDDREGNWNNNSRPRFGGRSQSQNQVEKPSFRMDRSTPNNRRSDRSWNSKKDPLPPHHPRSGSFSFSNSTNRGSTNVAYGMYPPVQVVNHSEVSAPVVMLYPHDRNLDYSSAGEHLEFGSLGPAHFTGDKASPHLGEDSTRGINEQQDFRRDSDLSSPDQPPSPRVHRYSLSHHRQHIQ
ncbi:nucleotidyltransferase [Salix suchowensis]|nr:nucleotidyltransferase [Salix suchowensis]